MRCGSSELRLAGVTEKKRAEPFWPLMAPARYADRVMLGPAELFAIGSLPALLRGELCPAPCASDAFLTLLAQGRGVTAVRERGDRCALREGDLCLIDETGAFEMIIESRAEMTVIRLPRELALGYYLGIERLCGQPLRCHEPGVAMLGSFLSRVSAGARALTSRQRLAALGAIIELLGAVERVAELAWASADPRIARAKKFIELNLTSCDLTADDVARDQGVTRRHLDQLMVQQAGRTIYDHLAMRRLERACADLRNPACRMLSIAQIAQANGVGDAGHFARAFKRAFSSTPSAWRTRHLLA